MSGEGTYAPKSPDLSSFFSSGPTQPPPTSQPAPPQPEPYKTTLPQSTFLHQHPHQHRHHQAPANYYSHPVATGAPSQQPQPQVPAIVQPPLYPPQLSQPHNSAGPAYSQLSPHSPHRPLHHQYPQPATQAGAQAVPQAFPPHGQDQTQGAYGLQPPTAYQNYYQPYGDGQYQPGSHTQGFGKQEFYGTSVSLGHIPPHPDSLSQPQPQPQSDNMPPRRSAASSGSQQPPVLEPSPVRTKFPTARIKRIMQADEEVGKVAQQTPIAVGKALEMFMIHIVTKSAEVAKEKNSKRVTAAMLKQVVESDEQWDFLREIVSKVDVEQAGKSGAKPKAESESEEEPVEKKKGRGGRKKKAV